MLYKEIPFVRFTLPLVAGILLRYISAYALPPVLLVIIYAAIIIAFYFSRDRKNNPIYGLTIFIFFIASGFILYSIKHTSVCASELKPSSYTVRIDKMPLAREKSVKVASTLMRQSKREIYKPYIKIMLYFPADSKVAEQKAGDLIHLYLKPLLITDFDTLDNFDYQKFMIHKGYKYLAFAGSYDDYGIKAGNVLHKSINIQNRLLEKYRNNINNERSLAIVSALTLGHREMMDEEIKEVFTEAGISHILAVSGLHVGIISLIISGLLKMLRLRPGRISLILIILSIWIFAFISGLSPSVSRASIMFTFIYIGKYIGRHVNPVNSLLASAFILLFINPFILFSISFQLSYSAVLTILLFFKKVDGLVSFSGILLKKTWSLISITLLAQLGTLPFVLFYFKAFPLLSIISNIFAIPLAFIILISGILFLACPTSFFLSEILAYMIEIETELLYSIADWVSNLI